MTEHVPATYDIQTEAHRLLDLGLVPVPAISNEKRPAMPWKGLQSSPPSHEQLDDLFTQHPRADGLGILTNGLVIIDVDMMEDGAPNPFLDDPNVAPHLKAAPAVQTPSGGTHFYFKAPAGASLRNSTSLLAPRVDVRADGGFLMVPPSARGGKPYVWMLDQPLFVQVNELPELPKPILARLAPDPAPQAEPASNAELDPIHEGERNNVLFRMACRWRRDGHFDREIMALLELHNRLRCTPQLRATELSAIARSASRYPTGAQDLAVLGRVDEAGKPATLAVLSATEFKLIPPPKFVIEHVLPSGVVVLYAAPGLGKSLLALAIGSSVARGTPLFGNEDYQVSCPGWVLFVLPEGVASWAGRVRAYDSHHFHDDSPDMLFINDGINIYTDGGWSLLEASIHELTGQRGIPPAMIVVDTLAAATPGANENAIEDMGLVMSRLQSLAKAGSNILLVHHSNKGGDYRGHSAIKGSCDAMLKLFKDETTGQLELVKNKLRDAENIAPCSFEIRSTPDGPVPVGATRPGAWVRTQAVLNQHPGLPEALQTHGFREIENEGEDGPGLGGDKGVTLRTIQSTWNKSIPPEDRAARAARTRALIRLTKDLHRARSIEIVLGDLKGKQSDALDTVIRQTSPP